MGHPIPPSAPTPPHSPQGNPKTLWGTPRPQKDPQNPMGHTTAPKAPTHPHETPHSPQGDPKTPWGTPQPPKAPQKPTGHPSPSHFLGSPPYHETLEGPHTGPGCRPHNHPPRTPLHFLGTSHFFSVPHIFFGSPQFLGSPQFFGVLPNFWGPPMPRDPRGATCPGCGPHSCPPKSPTPIS